MYGVSLIPRMLTTATYCAKEQSNPEGQKPTRYKGQGILRICLFGHAGPVYMIVSIWQAYQSDGTMLQAYLPDRSPPCNFCILVFFDVG